MLEIKTNNAEAGAKILVICVGGAGNNAVNRMIEEAIGGVDFIGVNTDKQALQLCKAPKLLQIGEKLTKGLGAGAKPEIGERAAEESYDELTAAIQAYNMVFVTCGMGGGTGTGAAPIVAQIAKELGILTVGIVTKPFSFEGAVRERYAEEGIAKLRECVDSIIIIKNDNIFKVADDDMDAKMAMKKADEILEHSLSGITDIINRQGDFNLDFADLKKAMTDKGDIYIGIGQASGDNKGIDACNMAIENQILETDIVGASDVVYYVQGKVKFKDFTGVGKRLLEKCGSQANVFGGFLSEDNGQDSCTVTVIATGLHSEPIISKHIVPDTSNRTAYSPERQRTPLQRRTVSPAPVRKPVQNTASIVTREQGKITVPTFVKKTNREE